MILDRLVVCSTASGPKKLENQKCWQYVGDMLGGSCRIFGGMFGRFVVCICRRFKELFRGIVTYKNLCIKKL